MSFRKRYLTRPIHKWAKGVLPTLSATEAEAINSGDVHFEAQLFSGKPDWAMLRNMKAPQLTDEEAAFIDGPCRAFCDMIDPWEIDHHTGDIPSEAWDFLRENGFFGMIIPTEYGGLGFSAIGHSAVIVKISSRSVTTAVTVMVPNSLGPAELLLHYGTEDQKKYYLPRLARGEEVPCFALTEPHAGSDAASGRSSGVVCRGTYKGKEVLGIRLNWNKRYITLAPVATVIGLAFRLFDPEHLLGEEEDIGITCALIPRDTPGLKIGNRHDPMRVDAQQFVEATYGGVVLALLQFFKSRLQGGDVVLRAHQREQVVVLAGRKVDRLRDRATRDVLRGRSPRHE